MSLHIDLIRRIFSLLLLAGFIQQAHGQDSCIRSYGAANVEHFLIDLQHSVAVDNRVHVAEMIRFPIKVLVDGKPLRLNSKKDFLEYYDVAIDSKVKGFIEKQKFSDLFCNWQGIMVGRGEIWISGSGKLSPLKVITINNNPPWSPDDN